MNNIAIKAENICKSYKTKRGAVSVLDNASLILPAGSFATITGESGCGKSTLLALLGCLDDADSGSLEIFGTEVFGKAQSELTQLRNLQLGFVFQGYNLISTLTALQNVELPLKYRGIPADARRIIAEQALANVNLTDRASHFPYELSGGQQQRVAVARAVAAKPKILLADEPTGNLDCASAVTVMDNMLRLQKSGTTIIMITHDNALANSLPMQFTVNGGKIHRLR